MVLEDTPLAQFRARVMADEAHQIAFAAIDDPAKFIALALERFDIPGLEVALRTATGPDPIGAFRFGPAPQNGVRWPSAQWLPASVGLHDQPAWVDWIHFADRPLDLPFYENSLSVVRGRPFNRLFRYRMPLDTFVADAPADTPEPDGFVFHLSRCGSTLVAQMLAAVPEHVVVSEAPPLDHLLELASTAPGTIDAIAALRAMVAALTRDRSGITRHRFVKFDSWHTLALPLLRRAFPDTPWIFLYRDPVEVLVSHARMRGMQTAPGVLSSALFGLQDHPGVPLDDYAARVLARTAEAVSGHWHLGGGMVVDYRELPEAVETRILPHFGITPDAEARAQMATAAQRDAKAPGQRFVPDSEQKQREANDALRLVASSHLDTILAQVAALT